MAELLKNELTAEVQDDLVITQRVIRDSNTHDDFLTLVLEAENRESFVKKYIEDFDDNLKEQLMDIRKHNRGKPTAELESMLAKHKLISHNQKQIFIEKELPNIQRELPALQAAAKKVYAIKAK